MKLDLLRFWYSVDGALPSAEEVETAGTWAEFHQIIWTNLPENAWDGLLNFPHTLKLYYHPAEIAQLIKEKSIKPQFIKDVWQFSAGARDCIYADWDFLLINRALLPTGSNWLGTEVVRTTSERGGRFCPTICVEKGVRAHLGISRFDADSAVADSIEAALLENLSCLDGVGKEHPKWISNTLLAQERLGKDNFVLPLVVNPFPHFMRKVHFGGSLYNSPLPTFAQLQSSCACMSLWHGFLFPGKELKDLFARESNQSDMNDLRVVKQCAAVLKDSGIKLPCFMKSEPVVK